MGSGKTASAVKELSLNKNNRITYTNITTDLKNCTILKPEYIIKKTLIKTKRSGEKVFRYTFNKEFWMNQEQKINICLDEFSAIADSRASGTRINRIISQFQNSIRRVLGQREGASGNLIYITQQYDSIDIRARNACTQLRYHTCYYTAYCKNCLYQRNENSNIPEPLEICPLCMSKDISRRDFFINVKCFTSTIDYEKWIYQSNDDFIYKEYNIIDIENYFNHYNTLQWENLFEDYLT